MQLSKIEAVIEAILFTMGTSVPVDSIAKVIEQDEKTTKKIIKNMIDKYQGEDRGIQIIELDNAYQMCTKAAMYDDLRKITAQPKKVVLSDILLETLSIIAYKQPITKAEIEHIRGVRSDHAVNKLIDYDLVCEVGRMDAPGRPLLFGTSEAFLRNFGMQSLEDLPIIKDEELAKFKTEAEEEVQLEINDVTTEKKNL
ncbi:segregation and condensation protein B [Natranaerovirga pectinivora]|uniref:Segregation and condensation protein B n=1 Tax=Natranaerovirga pectinivora TaxID=682400 RepID=A0A4R3MKM8_9FIRM|nr:SMC-Scp complex subunit ScpB [Natranaerovirga pectinivora]TCT15013.1 segregation and condensation protein B [Natranaerovirga pectinivora]